MNLSFYKVYILSILYHCMKQPEKKEYKLDGAFKGRHMLAALKFSVNRKTRTKLRKLQYNFFGDTSTAEHKTMDGPKVILTCHFCKHAGYIKIK